MLVQLIQTDNDSGRSGARMGRGPGQILAGGAAERLRQRGHQVELIRVEARDPFPTEIATAFATARALAVQVRMASRQRRFPVVLSGNCMASLGSIGGLGTGRTGLLWLDAHADLHTPETTRSGFLDGMALATIGGHCWRELSGRVPGFRPVASRDTLLLGARDVEQAERAMLEREPVTCMDVQAMRSGSAEVARAVERIGRETEQIHLHIDLDVLDPEAVAPANEFAPPAGLLIEELVGIVRLLRSHGRLASATLSAYDPSLDPRHRVRDAALEVIEALVA